MRWQSAVKDLGARDRVVGWTAAQRAQWLGQVVTGVRFLLLPWVRVPHLASVMLSENVSQELKEFAAIFGPAYGRVETRELGELYLCGLLSDTERKNMEGTHCGRVRPFTSLYQRRSHSGKRTVAVAAQ